MICRICGDPSSHRCKRHGFLQKRIYPIFGLYPWECLTCGTVILYRARKEPHSQEGSSRDSRGPTRQAS
jgi:hypothetical protein